MLLFIFHISTWFFFWLSFSWNSYIHKNSLFTWNTRNHLRKNFYYQHFRYMYCNELYRNPPPLKSALLTRLWSDTMLSSNISLQIFLTSQESFLDNRKPFFRVVKTFFTHSSRLVPSELFLCRFLPELPISKHSGENESAWCMLRGKKSFIFNLCLSGLGGDFVFEMHLANREIKRLNRKFRYFS